MDGYYIDVLRLIFTIVWLLGLALPVCSEIYLYDAQNAVIGRIEQHTVQDDESLIEIARNYSVGFNAIQSANPDLDAFIPPSGSLVTLPLAWVLPEKREGLVINLSELRLFYFFKDSQGDNLIATFPIGIGVEGNSTPTGVFKITEKMQQPAWRVPPSIRKREPDLPSVVPPGPENPMGTHALRLSLGDVLIHGTHRPLGVGRRVSHGCMRLYPEDIPILYSLVPKGTKVTILRQPVKIGIRDDRVYIEVHEDDEFKGDYARESVYLLKKGKLISRVSMKKVRSALKFKTGFPVDISLEG